MKTPKSEIKSVAQPKRRQELIAYIEELADPELQQRFWIRHEDAPTSSGIDEVFHFFFDDTEIGESPFEQIGICLCDTEEAAEVKGITDVLESMLRRLGNAQSQRYLSDPMWKEVLARASAALRLFRLGDETH